jgi:lipopolysaccharide transport system ATP-binding protein
MSEIAIQVEQLGKKYILGSQRGGSGLLRDKIAQWLKHPFRSSFQEKSPDEYWALQDVSFSVTRGEVVGIVGRNGAGKSTLLKILSRITEPTTGRITVHGRVASLLEVGTGFHGELSGRENIFLNGAILGMTRAEIRRKFDEIVAFAEVERFLDTPVKRYSSGMYVRLAFAVAAHLEPEILIVDEVLAVGDAAFQKKCIGKMREVSAQQGRTVLFVSHNLGAVRELCDSAILLAEGRLQARGSVPRILELYSSGAESTRATVPPPSADLLDRAYFTDARLRDTAGKEIVTIPLGQSWQVQLNFRVARALDSLVSAVGITTVDGVPVQTAWAPPERFAPGEYSATFVQDKVRLAVGTYHLVAGLSDGGRSIQQIPIGRIDVVSEGAVGYFEMHACTSHVLNSMSVHTAPATSASSALQR